MISPSTTKGKRIKPLLAPTIFMMAISSLRVNVASLMVLDIMNSDTTRSTTIRIAVMTLTTLRTVMKPFAMLTSALTSATPGILSRASLVDSISVISFR